MINIIKIECENMKFYKIINNQLSKSTGNFIRDIKKLQKIGNSI